MYTKKTKIVSWETLCLFFWQLNDEDEKELGKGHETSLLIVPENDPEGEQLTMWAGFLRGGTPSRFINNLYCWKKDNSPSFVQRSFELVENDDDEFPTVVIAIAYKLSEDAKVWKIVYTEINTDREDYTTGVTDIFDSLPEYTETFERITPRNTRELSSDDRIAVRTLLRRSKFLEDRSANRPQVIKGTDYDRNEAACIRRVLKRAYPTIDLTNPDYQ